MDAKRKALVGAGLVVILGAAWFFVLHRPQPDPSSEENREAVSAPTLDDSSSSLPMPDRVRKLLSGYLAAAREWRKHPDDSGIAGAKQGWLDALVGVVRSVDPGDLPEGLLLSTISLARELGDESTAIEVAYLTATSGATPKLRLHGAVQYAELSEPGLSAEQSVREQHAQSLVGFANDALTSLSTVTAEDASWVLAMTEALTWQATEALRAAGKLAEAAELQEKAAPIVAGQAEAQLLDVPDSMRGDEAYERVAGLWIAAGNEDRALSMLEAIESMPNPRRSAAEHVLNVVSHTRSGELVFETGIAARWLESHPVWTSTADLRLAQGLLLSYANSDDRAADAMAIGEKILMDHAELLRRADDEALAQLQVNAKEWAGKVNVTASVLQAMATAARRLGDRELSDRYRAEFAARFPEHPSNKVAKSPVP